MKVISFHKQEVAKFLNGKFFIDKETVAMSKDSNRNYVHWGMDGRMSELMEEFCREKLPPDDIYVPPHHQPINPEDEDDVIPDQHAAFGIQRAQQKTKERAWKDLGLKELVRKGPSDGVAVRRMPR